MRVPMRLLRFASRFSPEAVCFTGGPDSGKRVALTFDDGPHPEVTPRILEVLADADAPSTFFCLGEQAQKWPALIRRIHSAGHQIACHGMQHISASRQNVADILENAQRCYDTLTDIAGARLQRDYRPPYGHMTLAGVRELRAHDYRLVYWSYDSCDSFVEDGKTLSSKLRHNPPPPGSILLFHDDYLHTSHALAAILGAWRQMGLSFNTVVELCPSGNG